MRLFFTVCSNNYLAQAKTLGDSLLEHHPECRLIVFLVDWRSEAVDYESLAPHEIVPVEDLGIPGFDEMVRRYTTIELNTSVKPFAALHLLERFREIDRLAYLDPDILVLSDLGLVDELLDRHSIVITPHLVSPMPVDDLLPNENTIMSLGLYNLGFLALRRSPETERMLEWWWERTRERCFVDVARGCFVDQLWINHVPILFDEVKVVKDLGLNVAFWNLHERRISARGGRYLVNDQVPLVFFHFSWYRPLEPAFVAACQDRITFEDRPDLVDLFDDYRRRLLANGYERLIRIPCHYTVEREAALAREKEHHIRRNPWLRTLRRLRPLLPRTVWQRLSAMLGRAGRAIETVRD